MPVPKPKAGESQDDYIPRCISFLENEEKSKPKEDRRPHKQIQAICFDTWRESKKEGSFFSKAIPIIRSFQKDGKHYLYGYVGFWEIPDAFGTVLTPEIVESSLPRLRKFPAVHFMHSTPLGQLVFDSEVNGLTTKADEHGFHVLVRVYDECEREWGMIKGGGWGFSYGLFPAPDGRQKKCFESGKCFDAFVKGVLYEVSVTDVPAHVDAVAHVLRMINGHKGEIMTPDRKKEVKKLEKAQIEAMLKEAEERILKTVRELLGEKQTDEAFQNYLKDFEKRVIETVNKTIEEKVPKKVPSEVEKTFSDVNKQIGEMDSKIESLRKISNNLKEQGEDHKSLETRIKQLEDQREKLSKSVVDTVEGVVTKQMGDFNKRLAAIENVPDLKSPATLEGQPVTRGFGQGFGGMLNQAFRRES